MGRQRNAVRSGDNDARPVRFPLAVGTVYRSARALTPDDVRRKRFSSTPLGRRGLVPGGVDEFLREVEAELTVLRQEVVAARDEANRYRVALRQWGSIHAHCHRQPERRPGAKTTNRPHWPALAVRQPDGRRTHE